MGLKFSMLKSKKTHNKTYFQSSQRFEKNFTTTDFETQATKKA